MGTQVLDSRKRGAGIKKKNKDYTNICSPKQTSNGWLRSKPELLLTVVVALHSFVVLFPRYLFHIGRRFTFQWYAFPKS